MSTAETSRDTTGLSVVNDIDLKFEVVVIPVADVDRAKAF
jgi:hypothetical protein